MSRSTKQNGKAKANDVIEGILFIFLIGVAVICLVCLIESFCALRTNLAAFSKEYSEALDAIKTTDGAEDMNKIDKLITHMENMQTIQKSSITNDLMSFVYGILSTILVGLCAGFVAKSRKISDDANEKVQEIKKVEKGIQETEKKLRVSLKKSKKQSKELKQQVTSTLNQSTRLRNNMKLIQIHGEIVYTKAALANANQVEANYRIMRIRKWMDSLANDKDMIFDQEQIKRTADELRLLESQIDEFSDRIEKEFKEDKRYASLTSSIENYKLWMCESIENCRKLGGEQNY